MTAEVQFEVRFANGDVETAESLWGARHIVARKVAFSDNPLRPDAVLPARIAKTGKHLFGGRVFVEQIDTPSDLSATE